MNSRMIIFVTAFALAGCNGLASAVPTASNTATLQPPAETATALTPPTIAPTAPAVGTATPTWVAQGPDQVKVPILLFHHIGISPVGSRYYVSPDNFDAYLKLLRAWGYATITTSSLIQAITQGASLPPRPLLITFDDGNEDNYTNAFPTMQKYGFTGVLYIVVQYMDDPNYLTTAEIKEMAAAGWEVGSHSETHRDLLGNPDTLRYEIVQSRKDLQSRLNVPILTFAYPFGGEDDAAGDYVHFAGYIAAMGASGYSWEQGRGNLFVLQRCEIKGSDTVKSMTRFLPWLGDPSFLPTDTPTPTATPTRSPIPTYTQYPTRTPKPSSTP